MMELKSKQSETIKTVRSLKEQSSRSYLKSFAEETPIQPANECRKVPGDLRTRYEPLRDKAAESFTGILIKTGPAAGEI